ncbi:MULTISPECIES: Ldh family oxidoreductase [Pseudidiomarina]|uniref:LDH2 family malate/lactate/ureidoglycolate dehydrogenase n=2 Tax=Pseudidiomarina TaxID=2800384 RepID=A0A368UWD6_9GAMM|nr:MULTISPECIES: Ldh family oxidoreductase [Pseudidiomarina]PWW12157.1 LDH2 family malate/lactate/ureidoglycolate dehydrogenase [Pseudidiomarina maritima]RBP89342.1 LDH2 family malate/lactate/ureidoglycolate dehydrogenase [Pseudidiomarina tainanensis]RCW31191.1 LDH2 family malate/lactate/ureidoglycolate dehydrogenase [Pseudidiomarina tainanensis]
MTEQKNPRIDAKLMQAWAQQCLQQAGATEPVAAAMAQHLVAADLLGFRTHGLMRLKYNVDCLQQGQTKPSGEPQVISQRGALELWDADLLSGLYVMPQAVARAIAMARDYGTGTVLVRRTQHVAALAVYLEQAVAAGMLIQMMCATPGQAVVAPHGAKSAWFSPNPFAIGAPTLSDPVLFDVSLSMTAAGKVRKALAEQQQLPYPALITAAGDYTCDPATFVQDPPSVLASLGGELLGYKGSGLNLFSELWTLALSQWGRHQEQAGLDANTVWIQVIDPSALGASEAFQAQAQALVDGIHQCTPITASQPVRIPGEGALARRKQQLQQGIEYSPQLLHQLAKLGDKLGLDLPPCL